MKREEMNKVKLGAFVLSGMICLVLGFYYIGSNKNIFHSTININAHFKNVNGLTEGNNVRFNGINVGTVSKVYAIADTVIRVEFTIDKESTKFINTNSIVSIGTDGLLGNKLINISPGKKDAQLVDEGDTLEVLEAIEMDNALRTLTVTNDNLKIITDNLKGVSEKLNGNNSLWRLLSDSAMAENVRYAVVNFKVTGSNTAVITGNLSKIVQDIKAGKGTVGALLTDTSFSGSLHQTIVNIKTLSDSVALISGNFKSISENLKNGKGSIGTLLTDTTFVHNLNLSMKNMKEGSRGFNENMEALKHIWPFKKYFRKHAKNNK